MSLPCISGCSKFKGQKIYASDGGPGNIFSFGAVDIWGNYLISGSLYNGPTGSAYIYERQEGGGWAQVQKLTGPADANSFGQTVAISLGHAAASTHISDTFPKGAVFVYQRTSTGWTNMQTLQPDAADEGYGFGFAIDIDGGRMIVGKIAGSVYIYKWEYAAPFAGVWTLEQKLTSPAQSTVDQYGIGVSISGNLAIVGAEGSALLSPHPGEAYIYEYDPVLTKWVFQQAIKPTDPHAGDSFGSSVAIRGFTERALVGAQGNNEAGDGAGAAYVFERQPGTWQQVAKLLPSTVQAHDGFSITVTLADEFAVVGSWWDDTEGEDAGAVYPIRRSLVGEWFPIQRMTAWDAEPSDYFGHEVRTWWEYFVVASPRDDDKGHHAGAAYAYEPRPEEPSPGEGLVLDPWPYIYIYTGCGITVIDTPIQFPMHMKEGTN